MSDTSKSCSCLRSSVEQFSRTRCKSKTTYTTDSIAQARCRGHGGIWCESTCTTNRCASGFVSDSGYPTESLALDVLFLKAVWGGILLSYGGLLESIVGGSTSASTNNAGLLRLVEGLVFPAGLTMIVLSGTELLTS